MQVGTYRLNQSRSSPSSHTLYNHPLYIIKHIHIMLILQTCIINVVVVFTLVDNQLTFSDL